MGTLIELLQKERQLAIGLMSGTSCDGVDAALCEIEGAGHGLKVRLVDFVTQPYSGTVRRTLLEISDSKTISRDDLCRFNFRLGNAFARAAMAVIEKAKIKTTDVDVIGSHGHTLAHLPPRTDAGISGSGLIDRFGSTWQIGEPAMIAEQTGIPVVFNFRTRDMAAGGQGAPLVPYVDYLVLSSTEKSRVVVNIGGITNVTYLPKSGRPEDTLAFDTGPGNMLIDGLVSLMTTGKQNYDKDAELARQGDVEGFILNELLQHPYLKLPPPKSTGREEFGTAYTKHLYEWGIRKGVRPKSVLRTATDFTAIALADACKRYIMVKGPVDELIISGGGALNPLLMERIRAEFEGHPVLLSDDYGLPIKAKEAICFAILARETILGRPSNLPSATGAAGPRILGQICPA